MPFIKVDEETLINSDAIKMIEVRTLKSGREKVTLHLMDGKTLNSDLMFGALDALLRPKDKSMVKAPEIPITSSSQPRP